MRGLFRASVPLSAPARRRPRWRLLLPNCPPSRAGTRAPDDVLRVSHGALAVAATGHDLPVVAARCGLPRAPRAAASGGGVAAGCCVCAEHRALLRVSGLDERSQFA